MTTNYDGLSEDCFRLVRTVTHHNHLCKITFYSKKTVSVLKLSLLSLVAAKSQISIFFFQIKAVYGISVVLCLNRFLIPFAAAVAICLPVVNEQTTLEMTFQAP